MKKLFRIILISLIFLAKPVELVHGCGPDDKWEIFMTGSHFAIGEIVDIDGSEILIDVADYFIVDHGVEIEITTSELFKFSFINSQSWVEDFSLGDYVVISLGGSDMMIGMNFCDMSGTEIYPVTSLDYTTLQVESEDELISRMLTDFVYHRGTYMYHASRVRVYRKHRQNPAGWLLFYDPTSLILGRITVLDEDEITIEIWDYVRTDHERVDDELPFEHLTLYRGEAFRFNDFSIGDDIAVALRLPTAAEDARTLTAVPTESLRDTFSINILEEDGSVQVEHIRGDASVSAFYTDLLQHRGNYTNVVTFGGTSRYKSVARLVDGELIMVYEEEEVGSEQMESADATREAADSDLLVLILVIAGIGGVLGVGVVLVAKVKKQVLSNEK